METITYLGCFSTPTESQKLAGAQVSFYYEDSGEIITILACKNGEVWHQWGAEEKYLYLNVKRVESWFKFLINLDN